jgi:HEAT repeat protein
MHRRFFSVRALGRWSLCLLPAALLAIGSPVHAARAADATADLVAKLKNLGDAADPKLVRELGGLHTRDAMLGLLDVYDSMHTVFLRREIVKSLIDFDGDPESEQRALQKLMDVATTSEEPELRNAALDALGECRAHGKDFLMMIVRSAADDGVREKAMKLHVGLGGADDAAFYREMYKPKVKVEDKATKEQEHQKKLLNKDPAKSKKDEGPPKPHSLDTIRALAFDAVAATLTPEELIEATRDDYASIRSSALLALESRGAKQALETAAATLAKLDPSNPDRLDTRVNEIPEVRVVAAQIVARISGVKAAPELMKRASSAELPAELRRALIRILVDFNDPGVTRELADKLSKPQPLDKAIGLRAAQLIKDEKLSKPVIVLLADRDPNIVILACKTVAERKDKDAVRELQKLVDKSKDRAVIRAALTAMASLRGNDPAWIDELVALTGSDDPEIRALALTALSTSGDAGHIDKLIQALDDANWSTRLAALQALERVHVREVIGPIIERMPKEEGRMQHEFVQTLWRMTGQPFDDNAAAWNNWWSSNGATFQPLSAEQFKKVLLGEEEWRLKQTTHVDSDVKSFEKAAGKPKFFGVRILSHHVLFLIDVSGSMAWTLQGDPAAKGETSRIDIAKEELVKCVQGLEPTAFFNILTFSGGVQRWFEGRLAAANPKNVEDARAFVAKQLPLGGTNTYDAIREAFKDPDVDTIFILSDGEPSPPGIFDPVVIRDHVRQWNENRHVVINTIAVGGRFQILRWLAEDSGGTHVDYH